MRPMVEVSRSLAPVVLAGATATGKSAVALELAELVSGEIISVDSMQVYRGLNVGTAKPSAEEQARVRHHLIDVVDLRESFDAARFVALAEAEVRAVQARGRVPILCGGTGLYFNAWINGLGEAPAPDLALRTELEAMPLPALLDELARKDWATFDEIDVQNRRRVVRAVEVIRLTGKPFSQQRAQWPERAPELAGRSFGIGRSREDTVRRIHRRVDRMFAEGLVAETERLLEGGLRENRTALQAIGYRQVLEQLDGMRGRLETIELVKVRTRQLAKRQLTWFRGQMDLRWVEVTERETPLETAMRLRDWIENAVEKRRSKACPE
ncbi:MAG: tRNA (adenosine(37)-N6)-dimethylallyltransferase MiaA [Verrucomicrobia bacterium]|nr:tRNA (adenosine(37)-N6)-dimethylallyltransferase MiaA [Verrucomicrobiota bacterium]